MSRRILLMLLLGVVPALLAAPPPVSGQAPAAPEPARPAPQTRPAPAQPAPAPGRPAADQPANPSAPGQAAPGRPAPAAKAGNAEVKPTGPDLQVMLDRAGFSPGIVDGRPGSNTKKALAAFQAAHDLPVTGELDPVTWQNLQAAAGGEPTAAEYTITAEDVDGPFVREIPEDMVEKSKLEALAYTSPLELLSEKFHTSPDYLRQLNPRASFTSAGERLRVPNVRSAATAQGGTDGQSRGAGGGDNGGSGGDAGKAANAANTQGNREAGNAEDVRVVVSKSESTLTVERGDDVLFFAPVSAGSEHDPLPIGDWKVKGVAKNPTFNYNPDLFWDAEPEHSKAKIPAGPNNPVGLVWIDLSKEHYGIHGTPEPRTIGKTLSHGCVRMTNWDVLTVAGLIRPGTPVLFRP